MEPSISPSIEHVPPLPPHLSSFYLALTASPPPPWVWDGIQDISHEDLIAHPVVYKALLLASIHNSVYSSTFSVISLIAAHYMMDPDLTPHQKHLPHTILLSTENPTRAYITLATHELPPPEKLRVVGGQGKTATKEVRNSPILRQVSAITTMTRAGTAGGA